MFQTCVYHLLFFLRFILILVLIRFVCLHISFHYYFLYFSFFSFSFIFDSQEMYRLLPLFAYFICLFNLLFKVLKLL